MAGVALLLVLAGCGGGGDASDDEQGGADDVSALQWDLRQVHDLDAVGWPADERALSVWEVGEVTLTALLPGERTLEAEGRVSLQRDTLAVDQVTIVSVFEDAPDAAAARDRAHELCDEWRVRCGSTFDDWVADGGEGPADSGSGSADPLAPGGPTPSVHVRQLRAVPGTFYALLELYWPPPR